MIRTGVPVEVVRVTLLLGVFGLNDGATERAFDYKMQTLRCRIARLFDEMWKPYDVFLQWLVDRKTRDA